MGKIIPFILVLFLLFSPVQVVGLEKIVTLATLDWAPYIGQDLPDKGYVYEIVVAAFEKSGYKTEISFFPWARAVNTVELGETDVLFPEYYDDTRKKTCVYSDPFPGGPVGLFKQKSMNEQWSADPQTEQTKALQSLKNYKFGVVRGYINTEEFDKATFLIKEEVASDEMNLKKLFGKRIDFIFIDKLVANHLIKTKYPQYSGKLEFMEPAMEEKQLYLAFSKKAAGYKVKLKAFNNGLKEITANGTLKKIMEKHGF